MLVEDVFKLTCVITLDKYVDPLQRCRLLGSLKFNN